MKVTVNPAKSKTLRKRFLEASESTQDRAAQPGRRFWGPPLSRSRAHPLGGRAGSPRGLCPGGTLRPQARATARIGHVADGQGGVGGPHLLLEASVHNPPTPRLYRGKSVLRAGEACELPKNETRRGTYRPCPRAVQPNRRGDERTGPEGKQGRGRQRQLSEGGLVERVHRGRRGRGRLGRSPGVAAGAAVTCREPRAPPPDPRDSRGGAWG